MSTSENPPELVPTQVWNFGAYKNQVYLGEAVTMYNHRFHVFRNRSTLEMTLIEPSEWGKYWKYRQLVQTD